MSHRLGSLIVEESPTVIGPDSGDPPTGPNIWEMNFTAVEAPTGTKFVMLHFTAVSLPAGNRLEVELHYDTAVFDSSSGSEFWTRPVKGNSVLVRYIDEGLGTAQGSVSIDMYGRGEGLEGTGATGLNANGDVFLLDTPFQDPPFANPAGLCGPRSWENVACLPAGIMKEAARSTGIMIMVHNGHVSSCSAALIDADLILTAGHCIRNDEEAASASITFDFLTECDGNRPSGYNPKFYKLRRVVRSGFARAPGDFRSALDYSIIQINTPSGGLGIQPLPIRPDTPSIGEPLFVIHHPRGAIKKVSRQPADPNCFLGSGGTELNFGCDVDNGSSGSPLFDSMGRIVGVVDWAAGCSNGALAATVIQQDFLTEPAPPRDIDVMIVFDRSGSMSLPGLSGGLTKLQEAKQAASLFVELLQTSAGHRAGLISFSTTPSIPLDFELGDVNLPNQITMVGPPPHNGGIIGGLVAGGTTTIGGGLQAAQNQLNSVMPRDNTSTILLMTDGLQNTPPMIEDVEVGLAGTHLCIVGFGTEASLDGPLLTRLAREHDGIYTLTGDGLGLKKFFTLCFGNIFASGASLDPEQVLPEGADNAEPLPFDVCGEDTLTVVLGWEDPESFLVLNLLTPGGTTITEGTSGAQASRGDTWVFLRLQLPFHGQQDGTWQIRVNRPSGDVEFPPPKPLERFFVSTVVDGGPFVRPHQSNRHYYTGDTINPRIILLDPNAETHHATATVEVTAPTEGTGNLLTQNGLQEPISIDGDNIGARQSSLITLERQRKDPIIPTKTQEFELFDDGEHDDGAMEPDGIFGNPLPGIARFEGVMVERWV